MSCEVFVLVKYYRKDTIRKAFVKQSIPSRNWVNSAGDMNIKRVGQKSVIR
jgi:hypothetical protein